MLHQGQFQEKTLIQKYFIIEKEVGTNTMDREHPWNIALIGASTDKDTQIIITLCQEMQAITKMIKTEIMNLGNTEGGEEH